jgi:3-methyl-2-oxobutanoate hydroxymethyltransferase
MSTAYTYTSACHVDRANIDVLLVGDSVGMVENGEPTTQAVTMDQMVYHSRSVCRAVSQAFVVSDMPFGSYECSDTEAYHNALRFFKEVEGVDAVKLEGPQFSAVRKLTDGGIAVMAHLGLTPQRVSVIGGFRAQGKTLGAAQQMVEDALRLQDAGAFALVLECTPARVAAEITRRLEIPTIGIGAGPCCDGQVLVYSDMIGLTEAEHYHKYSPRFCKKFAHVGSVISAALRDYKHEVTSGAFPGTEFSPYKMQKRDAALFQAWCDEQASSSPADVDEEHDNDDEVIKVY